MVLKLLNLGELIILQPLELLIHNLLERLLVRGLDLVGDVGVAHRVLDRVAEVLKGVLRLDLLTDLLVLSLELLGVGNHPLDLLLAKTALVVCDGNPGALSGAAVLGAHVQNTIGVDVKRHRDLRDTAGRRGDAGELELAEKVVLARPRPLSLEHLDEHARLVVGIGGEHLLLLRRDGRVPLDQGGHHATGGLESERQRGDVQKQQVLDLLVGLSREDGGLDGSSVGNGLVWVDGLVELLAVEVVAQQLLHLRDTGGSSDEDHIVDGSLVHLGVLEALVDRVHALAEEVHAQLLETGPGDGRVEVNALEQGVDLDRGLGGGGQGPLGALARGPQTPEGTRVAGDVLLVLPLELVCEVGHEPVVKVLSSQVGISGRRLDLEDALVDGQQGHIERTASQIEDEHVPLLVSLVLLVESVGDGSSGRFVDDTEHLKSRDDTGVLGGLPLRVVEVGRHGDHGLLDLTAEVGAGHLLHLSEDHGGDFLRGEGLLLGLVLDLDHRLVPGAGDDLERPVAHVVLDGRLVKLAADQTLGVEDGVVRVESRLVLGGISDQTLGVREGHVRRRGPVSLLVGDDLHAVPGPDSDAGVGRSQINSCIIESDWRVSGQRASRAGGGRPEEGPKLLESRAGSPSRSIRRPRHPAGPMTSSKE